LIRASPFGFKTDGCLSNAQIAGFVPVYPPQTPHGALYNPEMDKKIPKPTRNAATDPSSPATPAAPELSEKQRRYLRGLAHPLNPVILLGKEGLTEAVAKETARALHDHELIKVRGMGGDRDARDAAFAALAQRTGSALVHRIGNVGVLYRPRADLKRIIIPD
jgi:RNA-binding protein